MQLSGASAVTRVQVISSIFEPSFDALKDCAYPQQGFIKVFRSPRQPFFSMAISGDEELYHATTGCCKFPGVMLECPSLLMNPWKLPEVTTTNQQKARKGDNFGQATNSSVARQIAADRWDDQVSRMRSSQIRATFWQQSQLFSPIYDQTKTVS